MTVKNEMGVKVKTIVLEDHTRKCKVALWRDATNSQVRAGDFIQITDVITNVFRNETSLTTTSRTTFTVSIV